MRTITRLFAFFTLATAGLAIAHAQLDFATKDNLAARDTAMRGGTISYQEIGGPRPNVKEVKLAYTSDGRFMERWEFPKGALGLMSQTFVKGKGYSYMEEKFSGSDQVKFGGFMPRNDSPLFFIVEKPSLALGAGFSNLRHIHEYDP